MTPRLHDLAGAWAGDETLSPSPWSPGGPAHGEHRFAVALDGTAVVHDYTEERDGAVALTGHGVFMADGDDVLWWWFDSLGYPPAGPSRGRWDGDTLVLIKESPRGAQRATFVLAGDTLSYDVAIRLTGAPAFEPVVTARYARADAAAA